MPVDDVKEAEKETSTNEDNTPQDTTTPNVTIVSALLPVNITTPEKSADESEKASEENEESTDEAQNEGDDDALDTPSDVESTDEDAGDAQDTPAVTGDVTDLPTDDVESKTDDDTDTPTDEKAENPAESTSSEADTDSGVTPLTSEHKMRVILKALKSLESNLMNVIGLLEADIGGTSTIELAERLNETPLALPKVDSMNFAGPAEGGRVIEGVFNGNNMVGSDGELYTVPPNYASKSKLVEGDLLKLTITPKGSFIYKQIGPIERSRIIGTLGYDQTTGEWYATTEDKRWHVIKASVTYFKGDPGDEIVLLVPKNAPSKWAAVENIIKLNPLV